MKIKVRIDNLTFGGKGIGRYEGKVIFVPYSAPGDEVEVKIIKDRKTYSIGEIVRVSKASEFRRVAECKYFELCGGCHWQHIIYEKQLVIKEEVLRETAKRIGKAESSVIHNIVPSPLEFRYRHRLRLHKRGSSLGFYRVSSNRIISIEDCLIADEKLSKLFSILRRILTGRDIEGDAELAVGDMGKTVALYSNINTIRATDLFTKLREEDNSLGGFIWRYRGKLCYLGNPYTYFNYTYDHGIEIKMRYHGSVFSQVNNYINVLMVQNLLHFVDNLKIKNVLDLFCGTGNFSIPISFKVEHVKGIDVDRYAIEDAMENAKENKRDNCVFIRSDVSEFLEKEKTSQYDLIILDPPREGIKDIIAQILSIGPKYICYISCNPPAFYRDFKSLIDNGYNPLYSIPFDMFPQTYHLEIMGFMEKRPSLKRY